MTAEAIRLEADAIKESDRWRALAAKAVAKRVRLELRAGPEENPVRAIAYGRAGIMERVGDFQTVEAAIDRLDQWVDARAGTGPETLREELRAFGRRLAVLRPHDVAKKAGADVPIYRDFRDVVLPLAWDNVVDATRVDALEAAMREIIRTYDTRDRAKRKSADLEEAISLARGLVSDDA